MPESLNPLVRIGYLSNRNIYALIAGLITIFLVLRGGALIYVASKHFPVLRLYFGFDDSSFTYLGVNEDIPFLEYLYISAKLSYFIAGLSLLIGGIVKDPKLSRMLIGFKLPSLTGLILTITYLFVNGVTGVVSTPGGEVSISLPLIVGDTLSNIRATLVNVITPTLILTLVANILAILGRYSASKMYEYFEQYRKLDGITSVIFPFIPT